MQHQDAQTNQEKKKNHRNECFEGDVTYSDV